MSEPTPAQIEGAIDALLDARDPGTICPSEAARALAAGGDFRPLMEPVRAVAREMTRRGMLEITQRGTVVDSDRARGPIRLRRPAR